MSSLFIVVMTPFAYLGGRAYHDGWYAALRLDPNMFPLDPQGMLVDGAIGWGEALSTIVDAISHAIAHYWLEAIGILAAIAITWSALHRLHRRLAFTNRRKRLNQPVRRRWRAIYRWFRPSIKPTLLLAMAILGIFELIFGLGSIYGMVVLPTLSMGQNDAQKLAATGFNYSPTTVVKNAEGKLVEVHLVGCGPRFCALWAQGHASTVPVSAITWADSSPPASSHQRRQEPSTPSNSALRPPQLQ